MDFTTSPGHKLIQLALAHANPCVRITVKFDQHHAVQLRLTDSTSVQSSLSHLSVGRENSAFHFEMNDFAGNLHDTHKYGNFMYWLSLMAKAQLHFSNIGEKGFTSASCCFQYE